MAKIKLAKGVIDLKIVVRATDIKNNFGKYLQHAVNLGEVIIEKNGHPVAKLVSLEEAQNENGKRERVYVSDQLLGVLHCSDDIDCRAAKIEALEKKYGRSD